MLELLRTRFHIDKCKEAIYSELQQQLNWWPDVPSMTVSDLVDHFAKQWSKVEGGRQVAREKLLQYIESSTYDSKEDLIAAIKKQVASEKKKPKGQSSQEHVHHKNIKIS